MYCTRDVDQREWLRLPKVTHTKIDVAVLPTHLAPHSSSLPRHLPSSPRPPARLPCLSPTFTQNNQVK